MPKKEKPILGYGQGGTFPLCPFTDDDIRKIAGALGLEALNKAAINELQKAGQAYPMYKTMFNNQVRDNKKRAAYDQIIENSPALLEILDGIDSVSLEGMMSTYQGKEGGFDPGADNEMSKEVGVPRVRRGGDLIDIIERCVKDLAVIHKAAVKAKALLPPPSRKGNSGTKKWFHLPNFFADMAGVYLLSTGELPYLMEPAESYEPNPFKSMIFACLTLLEKGQWPHETIRAEIESFLQKFPSSSWPCR
jgi:hypothetical protein